MNTLRELLQDYLSLRRGLGFKLKSEGASLLSFIAFMEQDHADFISTRLALAWATLPTSVHQGRWARRLSYIRPFARYCSALDPRHEVPPAGLLPIVYQRPTPYFFTDNDIFQLLTGSLKIQPKYPFVGQTYYCLLGLLSVSGLRIGEALGLTVNDVDLDEGILTIRSSKFGKSRLVPLHVSTINVLARYREQREQCLAGRQTSYWFVNLQGERLVYDAVGYTFQRLLKSIKLSGHAGSHKPHLHDLRHRFALVTMLEWYRTEQEVERKLPVLSAYLGHVEIGDTYWYLSACPELLEAAAARLEQRWEQTP